jgi:hypothetical protein
VGEAIKIFLSSTIYNKLQNCSTASYERMNGKYVTIAGFAPLHQYSNTLIASILYRRKIAIL